MFSSILNSPLKLFLLLFILFFLKSVSSILSCSLINFPYIYGGDSGDTYFNAMDIDSLGDIVLGGASKDSSLTSTSATVPIIVLYNPDGSLKWAKKYIQSGTTSTEVAAVSFISTTDIAIVLNGGNLIASVLNVDGVTIKAYHSDTTSTDYVFTSDSMIADSSDHIMLATQQSSQWSFLKYHSSSSFQYAYQSTGSTFGAATCIIYGESSSYIYVGGYQQITTNSQFAYQTITRIDISSTSSASFSWTQANNQGNINSNPNPFYVKHIYLEQTTFQTLYSCSDMVGLASNTQFAMFTLSSSYVVTKSTVFTTSVSNSQFSCSGIYGPQTYTSGVYAFVADAQTNNFYFASISFSTGLIKFTTMSSFTSSSNSISVGMILSSTEAYYTGYAKKMNNSPITSYSKEVGFLMSLNSSQSCLSFTDTLTSSSTMTQESSSYYSSSAISYVSFSPNDAHSSPTFTSLGTPSETYACSSQQILTPIISNYTYTVGASSLYITYYNFNVTPTCTGSTMTYSADLQGGTALPSFIKFTSSSNTFNVTTSSASNAGTYTIVVKGTDSNPSKSSTVTFVLTVISDPCSLTAIVSSAISSYSYDISYGTTNTITSLAWTQTQSTCTTSITYQVLTSGGSNGPNFVSLTGSNQVQVYTISSGDVRVYNLKIMGSVSTYTSSNVTFTLTITNNCTTASISTSSIADQHYQIDSSTLNFTFNSWTTSYTYCNSFSYVATELSPTSGSLPSFISFNSANRKFTVYSASISDANTYQIQITGTGFQNSQTSLTFYLIVIDPCLSLYLTPSTVSSPKYYYITQAALSISVPSFTSSMSASICGGLIYTATQSTDHIHYSTLDFSIFSFVSGSSSSLLTVSSSNSSQIGTYYIEVTCQQGIYSNQTSSVTFEVDILDICLMTVITAPTVSKQTYYLNDVVQTFSVAAFNDSVGSCGSFTYSAIITLPAINILPTSFLVFNNETEEFQVETSTLSDVSNYTISLTGTLGIFGSKTITFILSIQDICTTMVISTSIVSVPITYYVTYDQISVSIPDFTFTPNTTLCEPLIYTIKQSTNGGKSYSSLDSSLFTFSDADPCTLQVSSTNFSQTGVYTFMVIASLGSYGISNNLTFNVSVLESCYSTTISTTEIINQSYTLNESTSTFGLPAFNADQDVCGNFTYEAQIISPIIESLPSFITFWSNGTADLQNYYFSVFSVQTSDVGTFIVQVTGTLGSYKSTSIDFQIIINNPCISALVYASSVSSPQSYYITDESLSISIPDFTSDDVNLYCGSMNYLAYYCQDSGETYSYLDNQTFSFTQGNPSIFNIYTDSISMAGTYYIKIFGQQGTYQNNSLVFQVNIIDRCATTLITPSSLNTQSYRISSSALLFTFAPFNESIGYCGPFKYTVTLSNGITAIDKSLITFTGSTYQFQVYTIDPSKVGSYNLMVKGALSNQSLNANFTFTLSIICTPFSITHSPSFNQSYLISSSNLTFQFAEFQQFPQCGYLFSYQVQLYNGASWPSFISFTQSNRAISVYTINPAMANLYRIQVVAMLNDQNQTSDNSLIINLAVLAQSTQIPVNWAPNFYYQVSTQVVNAGSTLYYQLPPYYDFNADTVTVTSNLGVAQTFVIFSQDQFIITPSPNAVSQTYLVTIKLQDPQGAYTQESFDIIVIGSNTTSTSPNATTNASNASYSYNYSFIPDSRVKNKNTVLPLNDQLRAKILSISSTGIMTIEFSDDILIPSNYSQINMSVLNLSIIPGPSSNMQDLGFNWTTTSCSDKIMSINLTFENPLDVSQIGVSFVPLKFNLIIEH